MAKLRPDLGRLGISDEEFNLLRSSIEGFMKSQGNPSLGGPIIKPLEHAKCLGSSRLEGEVEEMILLWTFLTYQKTPFRGGFLVLEDAVEDAVEEPGAMARHGEALVSDDNPVSMVATLITRRKEALRELQRYYMHTARLALHCLHSWPQGAPVASPLHGNNRGGFPAHGTNNQLGQTVPFINANEFNDSENMSLFARLLHLGVPNAQPSQQYRMTPQVAELPNAGFYNGRLVTASTTDTPCRGLQMATSQCYRVQRDDCFMSVKNSKL
ncbi:hypothetical protein COH21_008550 [Aspergillus flavus]|nr:hypothetical protein COH21_008550 [Aspergillus flavus]